MTDAQAQLLVWTVAALAVVGVLLRPFRWPEAVWAVAGALALGLLRLLPWQAGFSAVARGADVYLFLAGMMLLSEVARREGVFEWIAAHAVRASGGSLRRLFALVYGVGVAVTAILSNDATAVVLTPAVLAVSRQARANTAPFLFACAMVANAASFVFPISNPANLVVFGRLIPRLADWLMRFGASSVVAIVATYTVLWLLFSRVLRGACETEIGLTRLSVQGRIALGGIVVAACVLLAASACGFALGPPTAICGVLSFIGTWAAGRRFPLSVVRGVSWSILPLVAGLFVIAEAVQRTSGGESLARMLQAGGAAAPHALGIVAAVAVALASNLINNLPAGLLASLSLAHAHVSSLITDCILLGVDLGPNLSVTGSLATLLWLIAIRREGGEVSAWQFLKVGALAMPAALLPAVAVRLMLPG